MRVRSAGGDGPEAPVWFDLLGVVQRSWEDLDQAMARRGVDGARGGCRWMGGEQEKSQRKTYGTKRELYSFWGERY